jgi:hypothetical protein
MRFSSVFNRVGLPTCFESAIVSSTPLSFWGCLLGEGSSFLFLFFFSRREEGEEGEEGEEEGGWGGGD